MGGPPYKFPDPQGSFPEFKEPSLLGCFAGIICIFGIFGIWQYYGSLALSQPDHFMVWVALREQKPFILICIFGIFGPSRAETLYNN